MITFLLLLGEILRRSGNQPKSVLITGVTEAQIIDCTFYNLTETAIYMLNGEFSNPYRVVTVNIQIRNTLFYSCYGTTDIAQDKDGVLNGGALCFIGNHSISINSVCMYDCRSDRGSAFYIFDNDVDVDPSKINLLSVSNCQQIENKEGGTLYFYSLIGTMENINVSNCNDGIKGIMFFSLSIPKINYLDFRNNSANQMILLDKLDYDSITGKGNSYFNNSNFGELNNPIVKGPSIIPIIFDTCVFYDNEEITGKYFDLSTGSVTLINCIFDKYNAEKENNVITQNLQTTENPIHNSFELFNTMGCPTHYDLPTENSQISTPTDNNDPDNDPNNKPNDDPDNDPNNAQTGDGTKPKSNSSTVGIAVGVCLAVVVVAAVGAILFVIYRRNHKSQPAEQNQDDTTSEDTPYPTTTIDCDPVDSTQDVTLNLTLTESDPFDNNFEENTNFKLNP